MTMQRVFKIVLILFTALALPYSVNAQKQGKPAAAKSFKVKVVETFPHDTQVYTQGLFFYEGQLYESSGQYGQSFFRMADLKSGTTLRSFALNKQYFAEGAVALGGKLFLLTWLEKTVFVYDLKSFRQLGAMHNPREGWGLTTNGTELIMSDGSEIIYFQDPSNFQTKRTITVKLNGSPLKQLNELEYINGEIWANVYMTDMIVIIDPATGIVKSTVDCRNILPQSLRTSRTDVLNGIAYNPADKKIYITGKYWPKLFRIELK